MSAYVGEIGVLALLVVITAGLCFYYSFEVAFVCALGASIAAALFLIPGQWAVIAALGAATGAIELIGRYKDAPFRALPTYGASIYIAVNIVASLTGLYLLQTVGASFISETDPTKRAIYEILVAGFGSLTFLRSSIFKIRFDDNDISVGPALLLDVLLAAADRGVDRRRGADRAREAAEAMKDVSFDKAISSLPPFCFALMQNLTNDEQSAISTQLDKVQKNVAIDPHAKSLLMGLLLMNFVGVEVLKEAVGQLAPYIKYDLVQAPVGLQPSVMEKLLNEAKRGISGDPAVPQPAAAPPAASRRRSPRSIPQKTMAERASPASATATRRKSPIRRGRRRASS
jgi:hypothetical protein